MTFRWGLFLGFVAYLCQADIKGAVAGAVIVGLFLLPGGIR